MNYLKIIIPISLLFSLYFVFPSSQKEAYSQKKVITKEITSLKTENYTKVIEKLEKKSSIFEEVNIENELRDFEAKSSKLRIDSK